MYEVRFVRDQELPEGHDFVLAHAGGESVIIAFREGAVTPDVLEGAWAAYRSISGRRPRVPTQARSSDWGAARSAVNVLSA